MDVSLPVLAAGIAATSAPLVFAALGETLTEKAGVINLSLDGTILLAAMTGFVTASATGSVWPGFAAAAATGMAVALILALVGIWLGQSQVAVGFALTFLCRDLAYFLGTPYSRTPGPQLLTAPIPGLNDLPVLGPVLFNHSLIVYGSFLIIPLLWYFMFHTRQGLILRAVGENPEGCWARGIRPRLTQTIYTALGGALVGLGGAAYSLAVKPGWGRPQGCEGIGWIALALVIFGGWHPLRVALGAYIFGLLQMSGIIMQDMFPTIPSQIFQVAPFPLMIFTLVLIHLSRNVRNTGGSRLLALLSGTPPRALGRTHRQD
ncbi:MAG: ABC transporter permease [Deltaproteobacteria bacterium]|nr:ABC transporter permease [Deltaproteobacteria bacterium]